MSRLFASLTMLLLLIFAAIPASGVMCVQPWTCSERSSEPPTTATVSDCQLGFVDGPNLYAYVMQNPWTAFDPDGLESKLVKQTLEQVPESIRKLNTSSNTTSSAKTTSGTVAGVLGPLVASRGLLNFQQSVAKQRGMLYADEMLNMGGITKQQHEAIANNVRAMALPTSLALSDNDLGTKMTLAHMQLLVSISVGNQVAVARNTNDPNADLPVLYTYASSGGLEDRGMRQRALSMGVEITDAISKSAHAEENILAHVNPSRIGTFSRLPCGPEGSAQPAASGVNFNPYAPRVISLRMAAAYIYDAASSNQSRARTVGVAEGRPSGLKQPELH